MVNNISFMPHSHSEAKELFSCYLITVGKFKSIPGCYMQYLPADVGSGVIDFFLLLPPNVGLLIPASEKPTLRLHHISPNYFPKIHICHHCKVRNMDIITKASEMHWTVYDPTRLWTSSIKGSTLWILVYHQMLGTKFEGQMQSFINWPPEQNNSGAQVPGFWHFNPLSPSQFM